MSSIPDKPISFQSEDLLKVEKSIKKDHAGRPINGSKPENPNFPKEKLN